MKNSNTDIGIKVVGSIGDHDQERKHSESSASSSSERKVEANSGDGRRGNGVEGGHPPSPPFYKENLTRRQ